MVLCFVAGCRHQSGEIDCHLLSVSGRMGPKLCQANGHAALSRLLRHSAGDHSRVLRADCAASDVLGERARRNAGRGQAGKVGKV